MSIRLNKLMAERGIGARRKCDVLIQEGHVRVNGRLVTEPGTQIEIDRDKVEVNGRPLPKRHANVYFVLNKPVGVISTLDDPQGRQTVKDYLPPGQRLFPVGRLDADTSGLLLLTNDGELAHHLMHPRYGVDKVYRVRLGRAPSQRQLDRLANGVEFEPGVVSSPARVRRIDPGFAAIMIEVVIHEGRFRQVRRMCEAVGIQVTGLHRVGYGPVRLGPLPRGMWRELSEDEVERLRKVSARPRARTGGTSRGHQPGGASKRTRPEGMRAEGTRGEATRGEAAYAPTTRKRAPEPPRPEAEDFEDDVEYEDTFMGGGIAPKSSPVFEDDDDGAEAVWPVRASRKRGDADFVQGGDSDEYGSDDPGAEEDSAESPRTRGAAPWHAPEVSRARGPREPREPREPRKPAASPRAVSESRAPRETRETRDTRDTREPRRSSRAAASAPPERESAEAREPRVPRDSRMRSGPTERPTPRGDRRDDRKGKRGPRPGVRAFGGERPAGTAPRGKGGDSSRPFAQFERTPRKVTGPAFPKRQPFAKFTEPGPDERRPRGRFGDTRPPRGPEVGGRRDRPAPRDRSTAEDPRPRGGAGAGAGRGRPAGRPAAGRDFGGTRPERAPSKRPSFGAGPGSRPAGRGPSRGPTRGPAPGADARRGGPTQSRARSGAAGASRGPARGPAPRGPRRDDRAGGPPRGRKSR
jgi:pseudouridine synthase